MHTLKQVYIYVICVALYGWIMFKVLFGFEFSKTLISSDLFYPEKPNSKSKYILGLSLKAKNVELVELYKVGF